MEKSTQRLANHKINMTMKISDLIPYDTEPDALFEIRTIGQLPQPTKEIVDLVNKIAVEPVENFTDTYAGLHENIQLVVAIKQNGRLIAYSIGMLETNNQSSEFSTYLVPRNLYSWAKDNGKSALKVIKAMIRLSHYPVLSDINLSPPAKKFLQRKVETGELNGEVFNLKTGQVSAYDPDIWITDDDERILMMEHMGRNHLSPLHSLLVPTGTWNWRQMNESNRRKRRLI